MNSLGLSLQTIAKTLNCHPTTVTQRLRDLNIPPADTRRAFMEDIYNRLSNHQKEFLAQQLSGETSVKDYVRQLIIADFNKNQNYV